MILGYFLYEQFILGVAAIVEVPINTMQMTIGTILSISIVRVIEKVWR
jgi:glycopeptide antibiotics resistance protein